MLYRIDELYVKYNGGKITVFITAILPVFSEYAIIVISGRKLFPRNVNTLFSHACTSL